jgi:hypothetical protein
VRRLAQIVPLGDQPVHSRISQRYRSQGGRHPPE